MPTNEEILQRMSNPIADNSVIQEIINVYAKSKRTCGNFNSAGEFLDKRGIYSNFTNPIIVDTTTYNQHDQEKFLINLYNRWIDNILSLTPQIIDALRQRKLYTDIDGLINTCRRVGKLNSIQDVENFKKLPIIQQNNKLEYYQGADFDHIDSKYLSCYTEAVGNIKHRFYIGAKHEDVYKLINEFQESCLRQKIPFYYKFDIGNQKRSDTIVIYSDDKYFSKYFEILEDIKQKYPDVINNCSNPSFFAGKIDNWLGIADEPEKIYKDTQGKWTNPSFTQTRGVICEEVLDSVCVDEFSKYSRMGKTLEYNGKNYSIYTWLRSALYATMIEEFQTISSNNVYFTSANIYKKMSDSEKAKVNRKLHDYINSFSDKDLMMFVASFRSKSGERWLQDPIDIYTTPLISNPIIIDEINNGCNCRISLRTMDFAMKKLVPIFQKYNNHFIDDVKLKFRDVCTRHHVDANNFAVNSNARQSIKTNTNSNSTNSATNNNSSTGSAHNTNSNNNITHKTTEIGKTPPPKPPISTIVTNYPTLEGKINYLRTLQFKPKNSRNFAEELENNQGKTREDCSCAYAIINGIENNVRDLTYREIENTLFEIIEIPDYDRCKNLIAEYMSVLNSAGYIPSYGTLGRALIKMEGLLVSGLSHSQLRKDILCDCLSKGNSMLISGEKIANYIKFTSGDKSPVAADDKSKVLLQMQTNYDKFGLNPENNTPKTYNKFIDINKISKPKELELEKKSDDDLKKEKNLHSGYKDYGFQPCEYTLTDTHGEKHDIWGLTPSQIISRLNATIIHGDKNEINKMKIICQNMQGHFKPTYAEVAQLTMVMNDFYKLNQDQNIDVALDTLKNMCKDKYNEGLAIAKFNAQKEGRPRPTYRELINVLIELDKQNLSTKQQSSESSGYSDGM